MDKKDLIPWGDALHYLKTAALHPQRRAEMIARALQELLICLPAVGTALIWPCQDRNVPWKVYYAGTRQEEMQRWLTARLDLSLDATLGVLQRDLLQLSDMPFPHLVCLQPAPTFPTGLWIVWTPLSSLSGPVNDCLERVRQTLEALLEIEGSEQRYFSSSSPFSDRAVIEALAQGDRAALSALLSLTQLIGKSDITYWGRAYQDVIEVKDHQGAMYTTGFVLAHGDGIGGRIAAYGTPIVMIEDYRNSPYRHPSVSNIADREQVRSMLALPVRSYTGPERNGHVAGILFTTRKTVKPFSLAERLLVQRLTRLLEPLPLLTRPSSFLLPDLPPVVDQKAAWYKVVLRVNQAKVL